jgi:hypothetical protein
MDDFTKYLHYQKDITAHKLKTINRYLKKEGGPHRKRTSQIDIIVNVLRIAGRPLHISEIIEIANRDFHVQLERDSIVSVIVKKIKAGQRFVRTAPNTFALKP